MPSFIISCGGTGGHLAPGVALLEALEAKGHSCKLVISRKEVDSRLIQKYPDIGYIRIPGIGFGKNPIRLARFAFLQTKALLVALRTMRKERPDAVIGFGGFLTAPVVAAAALLRIPVALHEANRRPGRAIRLMAFLATRVYLPQGVNMRTLRQSVTRYYGFPVRKEIQRIPKDQARHQLGLPVEGKTLLVLGGSQGAERLNRWVQENFQHLGTHGINVFCVTGMGKGGHGTLEVRSKTTKRVTRAVFVDFCDDMKLALSCADIVVARAGAGSIAEFMRCALPSILVPFPHSADDHQAENARYVEQLGAGLVVDEANIDRLSKEVVELLFNEWLLERMRKNLKRFEDANDLDKIIADLEGIIAERAQNGG